MTLLDFIILAGYSVLCSYLAPGIKGVVMAGLGGLIYGIIIGPRLPKS